jgi:glutathione S-transferase
MSDRRLYVFPSSPFSRRARLALARKGLAYDLVDARASDEAWAEAKRLCPIPTIPVFVDAGGRAVGDSTAIAHYLDRVYPDRPPIFPASAEHAQATFEATALVDLALNTIVDLGTRYFPLRSDAAWEKVKGEMLKRAQSALDTLAARAEAKIAAKSTWTGAGWSAADIWLTTCVIWIEGWPGRVQESQNIAQLVTLGLKLPATLSRWVDVHRGYKDLAALG